MLVVLPWMITMADNRPKRKFEVRGHYPNTSKYLKTRIYTRKEAELNKFVAEFQAQWPNATVEVVVLNPEVEVAWVEDKS